MSQDSAFYLVNIVVTVVLAIAMTHHWLGRPDSRPARDWMVAIWVLVLADVLFLFRPEMPESMARTIPTALVTVGLVVLLQAARSTAGLGPRNLAGWAVALGHLALLIGFVAAGAAHSHLRTALNGVVWGSLSLASWAFLRRGNPAFWRPIVAPANVFLVHAVFHAARTALAIGFEVSDLGDASRILSTIGDVEVSFFVVALFGSLLVADLLVRSQEIRTLSGLLPICAWCSKIRDDEGYWSRVEEYLEQHTAAHVTHSICRDCADRHFGGAPPDGQMPLRSEAAP